MLRCLRPRSRKRFERTAEHWADHDALIVRHQNTRLTFADLSAEVERTARGLAGLGLRTGDRVGVWSTNCVEWVVVHLACARIGAVLVNVNPAYRAYELAFVLRKSGMKALFLWERDSRSDYKAILEEAVAGGDNALQHVVYFGTDSWDGMRANGADIAAADVAAHRHHEYPVHFRDHRVAEGRAVDASQPGEQRQCHRARYEDHRTR